MRDTPIGRRRSGLEELRTAHRIVVATRPVVHPLRMLAHQLAHVVGFIVAPLAWDASGGTTWTHDAAEIDVARDGVRRALTACGLPVPAGLDGLSWDHLVVLIEETFASVRDADPRLSDVPPLDAG